MLAIALRLNWKLPDSIYNYNHNQQSQDLIIDYISCQTNHQNEHDDIYIKEIKKHISNVKVNTQINAFYKIIKFQPILKRNSAKLNDQKAF